VALVCALLWAREREITDTLVDLLSSTVHKINARAETRSTRSRDAQESSRRTRRVQHLRVL